MVKSRDRRELFVIPTELCKSGPHKYISRKRGKDGKWVYEYHDDAVKRIVDLLLDFLSNPKRSVTVGQVMRSFRTGQVVAKDVIDTLVQQGKISGDKNAKGVTEYRQVVPKHVLTMEEYRQQELEHIRPIAEQMQTGYYTSHEMQMFLPKGVNVHRWLDATEEKGWMERHKAGSKYVFGLTEAGLAGLGMKPRSAPAVEKPKQGKVDPSLWVKQPKFGVAGGPDEYFLTEKGEEKAALVATGLTPPKVAALRDLFALGTIAKIEQHYGSEVRQTPFGKKHGSELSMLSVGGYVRMHTGRDIKYSLTEKGNSALIAITKEEQALLSRVKETDVEKPKEPPKVLVEPPKKKKAELQQQKKELQKEAKKVVASGGQLSLDFTVKMATINDKISEADITENVDKVVEEVQKPVTQPDPPAIKVAGKADADFTREFGEHVWGSKADKWAILTVSDNLRDFPPAEQAKICTKKRLMTDTSPEEMLDSGVSPSGVLLRKVVERCVQAKAGDSLLARQGFMDGITFLDRSLEQCHTAQDVKEFIQEWYYLAQGRKRVANYSKAEMEKMLVAEAKRQGKIPESVSVEQYIAAKEKYTKYEKADVLASRLVFLRKNVSKNIDEALVAEAEDARVKTQAALAKATEEFDKVGGKRGTAGIYAVNVVEEQLGRGDLQYKLNDGKYLFYERDPDLSRDVKENPYTLYAAALGPRIARLVGGNGGHKAPKLYRDAVSEIHRWTHYDPSKNLTEDEMEARALLFLEPKKRGDTKTRFRWKRETPESVERVGGQEVSETPTPAELAETFGLPNVQMGNWVKNDMESAKSHLAGAQGALLDLAELMGVDPTTVGLNGRLSLSLGGRGGGSAKAHYEPSKAIINLTKFAGGGSLAHEWAHAFDNLIPRAYNKGDTSAMPMISDGAHEGIPERIKDAYNEVMGAIRYSGVDEAQAKILGEGAALDRQILKTRVLSEEYRKKMPGYRKAKKDAKPSNYFLDAATVGGSENSYWTRGHEMFARAFEAYIEDTLSEQNRKSSYLASGTQKQYKTGKVRKIGDKHIEAQIYPQGEERKRINAAMKKLIHAMREDKVLEKALKALDQNGVLQKSSVNSALVRFYLNKDNV